MLETYSHSLTYSVVQPSRTGVSSFQVTDEQTEAQGGDGCDPSQNQELDLSDLLS